MIIVVAHKGAVVVILYLIVMVFVLWCVITGKEERKTDCDPDVYFADDVFTVDELDVIEEDICDGN